MGATLIGASCGGGSSRTVAIVAAGADRSCTVPMLRNEIAAIRETSIVAKCAGRSRTGAMLFSEFPLSARRASSGPALVIARISDGYQGWPTYAPFDAIIVTAAPDHVPKALVEQLKPEGRMVIPVGSAREQALKILTKNPDGTTTTTDTVPVSFVPLKREPRH